VLPPIRTTNPRRCPPWFESEGKCAPRSLQSLTPSSYWIAVLKLLIRSSTLIYARRISQPKYTPFLVSTSHIVASFSSLLNRHLYPAVLTLCACTPPLDQVLQLWDFLLAFGVHLNVLCVIAQLLLIRDDVMASPRCARSRYVAYIRSMRSEQPDAFTTYLPTS
jgi:hypothetical protein